MSRQVMTIDLFVLFSIFMLIILRSKTLFYRIYRTSTYTPTLLILLLLLVLYTALYCLCKNTLLYCTSILYLHLYMFGVHCSTMIASRYYIYFIPCICCSLQAILQAPIAIACCAIIYYSMYVVPACDTD